MKTIKALEPITAYGPDKLMLFVGETAEIEDTFAQQLINEGKAEEFSGSSGGINLIRCKVLQDASQSIFTLENATALADYLDDLREHPEKSYTCSLYLEYGGEEHIRNNSYNGLAAPTNGSDVYGRIYGFSEVGGSGIVVACRFEDFYKILDSVYFERSDIDENGVATLHALD